MPVYDFTYTRTYLGDKVFSLSVSGENLEDAEKNLRDNVPDIDTIVSSARE